jgi:uncharacterized protein
MKTKLLTLLLALTFLFLFSGSVYGGDFEDGIDAFNRKDHETAYNLLLPLAELGNVVAQNLIGTSYSFGLGVPQNHKEAIKWYRLSAEQGDYMGQVNLGMTYYFGWGVPKNYVEASKLWRMSAEQGSNEGQYLLGKIYRNGQGVPKDYVLAHMWWNICGSTAKKDFVKKKDCVKNRNIVEEKMSPSQIEKAQELAKNWKPKKK